MKNFAFRLIAPLFGAALIAAMSFGAQAETLKAKSVIELFTSQGCSSCPPADKLLGVLAKRDDIIALSFPVHYWDYLGWKDTLASPAYSARQYDYARKRGDGQVYTPQIVVNGVAHAVGSRPAQVAAAIKATKAALASSRVGVTLKLDKDRLTIDTADGPEGANMKDATIWLALVKRSVKVKIRRGENTGRTITYYNVVRDLRPIGMWSGKRTVVQLPKEHLMQGDNTGCTVFIQKGKGGPIIGAAELKSW